MRKRSQLKTGKFVPLLN